jgi:CDGSH-type Zn-finger protein
MAEPVRVNLEAGKEYHYCTCGKSKDSVLCDGSHKGTEFTPMAFSVEESKEYYLCTCQKSKNQPFCDGSHTK